MITKLYVENDEVGAIYNNEITNFELTNIIETEDCNIYQMFLYVRNFKNFFTIFLYQNFEGNQDYYIIDTHAMDKGFERYDALKLDKDVDMDKLIINMILDK